jgi:opacity protein-like surface antigen
MRKSLLFSALTMVMTAALAAPAEAQVRAYTIGISGGPSIPLGSEFREEARTGYHVQGSVGFAPAALPVGIRADLLWQVFPDAHAGSFRQIGGFANALVGVPFGPARPYLLGGVGVVNHTPPDEDHGDHAHEGESETNFAFALGGGLEFPFLGLTGVLEARFMDAGGDHRGVPISFGIRF